MRIPAKAIPRFNGLKEKISGNADNSDLRAAIMAAVPEAVEQTKQLAPYFKTTSDRETAKKIFDYLKQNVKYKADDYRQVIQLPSAIMQPGAVTDCKSLSLFTAAILQNLGIPWHFVLASYTDSTIPGHIYVQTDSGVIIDVVWGKFNSEKKAKYKYQMNYKSKTPGMGATEPIAGNWFSDQADKLAREARELKERLEREARELKEKLEREAREAAAKAEAAARAAADRAKAEAERLRQQAGELQGRIDTAWDKFKTWGVDKVKAIIAGAKTIGLGPGRNLFLIVVKNNFDGLANKLSRINQDELRSAWNKAGGNWTNLTDAIRKGASKRSINIGFLKGLEALTKISGVNGIGAVDAQQLVSILSSPAVQAAIISLAGGVGTTVGAAGGAATGPGAIATAAAGGTAGTSMGAVVNVMVKILPALLSLITNQDRANQDAIPPGFDNHGNDPGGNDQGSQTNLTPIIIGGAVIAGLALVYFATKKKK